MLIADFTLGHALLTVLEIFIFAAWLMILFTIFGDLFRDHDTSGWGKAGWVIFLIFVPFLGAFIYLIARGEGMRDRTIKAQEEAQQQFNAYVKEAAGDSGGTANELAKIAELHDAGKLTDAEYEQAKAKIVG